MTTNYIRVFGQVKPVIAMVHLGASPGAPLFDSHAGIDGIVECARKDLKALQAAGFDAVMFGNENDRPYELKADVASVGDDGLCRRPAQRRDRVALRRQCPVGSDLDSRGRRGDRRVFRARDIFTGAYASDMGSWTPDAGAALRYRKRLDRGDLALLYNVSAEFAYSLDRRSVADRARSAVFSSIPDAILVSGAITGEAARMEDLEETKRALPGTPVLANTGVKHATVRDVLAVADGCIVGSALKVDGDTWKPVDPDRASEFMRLARVARKG